MKLLYFKDLFTIGCIASGFAGSLLAIGGALDLACCSMLVSFLFDITDGAVARMTGRANVFGKIFDNVADLIPYSVAPACIAFAYVARLDFPPPPFPTVSLLQRSGVTLQDLFASAIGAFPLVTGCLRLARNQAYPVDSDGFDLGLSRPASAFLITGIAGNHFSHQAFYTFLAPPAIVAVSFLGLGSFPFVTNKGLRFSFAMKCLLLASLLLLLASWVVTVVTREPYFMDLLLVFMTIYLFGGYAYTTSEQRSRFCTLVRRSRGPEIGA